MTNPDYYYSGSEQCEIWQCDDLDECCGETWAENCANFKIGDRPMHGTKLTVFRGESKPYKIDDVFGKYGFSEMLSERLYDLLGEDGSEHTEVSNDIDESFLKWLGGELNINWFKIVNVQPVERVYDKFTDKWLASEQADIGES